MGRWSKAFASQGSPIRNRYSTRSSRALGPASTPLTRWSQNSTPLGTALAQLHGIYILAQNRGRSHPRRHACRARACLVRKVQSRAGRRAPASQHLLEPIVVELKGHELDTILESRAEWEQAGFDIDALGPTRLALRRVPAMIAGENVTEIVKSVVRDLELEADAHHLDGRCRQIPGHTGVPYRHSRTPAFDRSRDECLAAANGSDRSRQPVQSRPPHLGHGCRCRSSTSCFCADGDERGRAQPRTRHRARRRARHRARWRPHRTRVAMASRHPAAPYPSSSSAAPPV